MLPNILLGGSHSGNMSAAEMPLRQAVPMSFARITIRPAILHGVFKMHEKAGIDLPQMVQKATLNPAKAVGLAEDYGSIAPGKKAGFAHH